METPKPLPLCVDLDGTLVHTDTLLEMLVTAVKKRPWSLIILAKRFLKGKHHFKEEVSRLVTINPELLPYNEELLAWLQAEYEKGRELCLATASHEMIAHQVAKHLGIFQRIVATDTSGNLSGTAKANMLTQTYGEKKFAYIGNSKVDIPVWQRAGEAIVVQANPGVIAQAEKVANVVKVFPDTRGLMLHMFAKSIRMHQWVKNLLIFVPILTAHMLDEADLLSRALLAFVSFSLMASSIYILNDMMDLEADRQHATKRFRPMASGKLSLIHAGVGMAIMIMASFFIGAFLSPSFLLILGTYVILNIAYSFYLKRVAFIDVILLAFLYVIRLMAGSSATSIPISIWLLLFAGCIFISLALVKRTSELTNLKLQNKHAAAGRGYTLQHRSLLFVIGLLFGYISLGVFALYLVSNIVDELYTNPVILWLLLPVFFFWISRIWYLSYNGRVHEDPVAFAVKDPISYLTGFISVIIIALAQ